MMRRVGNLNNKIIVPAHGRPGADMIAEINELLNLGIKNIGYLARFRIDFHSLWS